MTSDSAIPRVQDEVPGAPRDMTRLYFRDNVAFGRQHARPSTAVSTGRTWDDDQLYAAAHVGADGRDLHADVRAALCARYIDLAQDDNVRALELQAATVRAQTAERQLAAMQGVTAGMQARLALVTRQRDQAQYERTLALHHRAGTTPVGIQIALDRAARAVTEPGAEEPAARLRRYPNFDDSDTTVINLEDMHPIGGGR